MSLLNWGLLFLLACLWGSSFFYIEVLLEEGMPPMLIVFLRVSVALPFLALYCLARRERFPTDLPTIGSLALMGLINNALPFSLIALSQTTITGGLASILNSTTAFFAVVVAAIFLRDEPLSPHRVVGVLTGIAGVAVIVGLGNILLFSVSDTGQLLMICSSISYAFSAVWGKIKLRGVPGGAAAIWMLGFATLMLTAVVLHTGDFAAFRVSVKIALCVVGLSVFGTGLAYLVYFRLLRSTGASNLMLVTVIIPVVAASLDALVLAQFLKAREIVGFLVILAGLAILDGRLVRRFGPRSRKAPG